MKNIFSEFKAFAMKGNVIELAVAVVIGGAFGKIVSSLVDNIIMPILGVLLGGINFRGFAISVGDANITYGVFLQNVIDFLIIAMVIFVVIKAINHAEALVSRKKESEQKSKEPTEEVKLLREIRDSLRKE